MDESKIKKIGMIACVMGIVFLMFISIGYANFDGVVSKDYLMDSVYHDAGITEEMLDGLENGSEINLDLAQLNMLIGGVQYISRWESIMLISQILWGVSLFLALGVFLVDLVDADLKKQMATLIFVENILALFPIAASFLNNVTFSAFSACSILVITVIAVMTLIYAVIIVARHTVNK